MASLRALVLEPDRTVRAWLEAGLRSRGHAVVSRSAADEAWTAYERQHPMLALLDWAGQDGAEVCRRIRAAADGDRCVVLATGLSDRPGDVKDALDLADDYLPKLADSGVLEGRLAVAERRVRQLEERATAEEALKESERRYRSVVEAARDVIATLASDGTIISVNAAFEAMTGWRPAEWIGRGFASLVHPEDVPVAHALIERALRGEVPQPAEVRVLSRAGDWCIVEYSATGQALNGRAATVLATARDVTERKREQRREATRHVATRVLGNAPNLSEGASGLLQALCVGLGWGVGLLWIADRDGQHLGFESLWHLPGVDAGALLSASRAARPRPGEGPVGKAWQTAAAVWTVDGAGHGLRAGVAVPIRCGAEVAGVLQLLSPEPRPLDHLALRTAEEIAAEIGNLLARRQAEEALRESEERYALAARGANDGIWDWNLRTAQAYYSPRCKSLLGFEEEEEVGAWPEAWLPRVHPDDAPRVREKIEAHLAGHSPHFEDEHRVHQSDGSYRWVHCRGLALRDAKLRVCRMAGAITDINDRRAHDPLTSLPNRDLFVERLGRALARARRQEDTLFAVLFIDLDRFKVVNDSLGHLAGDQVLIAVARRLEACMRPGDVVGRFGGDEFVVLLEPIKKVGDATRVAERIQKALAVPLQHGGHELFTAASIGIALSTTGYERPEEILRDADTAMYRAKAAGKARHEVFHEGMRERAVVAPPAAETSPFAASA